MTSAYDPSLRHRDGERDGLNKTRSQRRRERESGRAKKEIKGEKQRKGKEIKERY